MEIRWYFASGADDVLEEGIHTVELEAFVFMAASESGGPSKCLPTSVRFPGIALLKSNINKLKFAEVSSHIVGVFILVPNLDS